MKTQISEDQWRSLARDGYLRVPGGAEESLDDLQAAVRQCVKTYPYGFADPFYYSGKKPVPLTAATARPDGRILIPYIGFMDFRILAPLANPHLHALLERIVGKGFYLSNTWYQEVPPGTARLGYHKDARDSITFNILLDEIGPGMGSTCLIPGSHINTPPARFCLNRLQERHPNEVDLTGSPGDVVLFSTEAWHARSENSGSYRTRRLFYNFYSRSSRDTTTWRGIVDPDVVDAARASLPSEYSHMFDIDPGQTRELALVNGSPVRKWAFAKSTSNELLRDVVYAACAYGKPAEHERAPGYLKPYTTRLTETKPYSALTYFANFRPIPTLKEAASFSRKTLGGMLRPARNVPSAVQTE